MDSPLSHPLLREESALRWSFLEEVPDACLVVSDRMEFVYANQPALQLLPGEWFGKRCFEVMPIADQTCAFHCPKIQAVSESPDVVYCEETVGWNREGSLVFGVGLIPLGAKGSDHARAVFMLRSKNKADDEKAFRAQLLRDAEGVRQQIAAALA